MSDEAQKQAGPASSLSRLETAWNKKLTHVKRRQFNQSYLNPNSIKSALVAGDGLAPGQWMDPIGTIHDADDDPLAAYE